MIPSYCWAKQRAQLPATFSCIWWHDSWGIHARERAAVTVNLPHGGLNEAAECERWMSRLFSDIYSCWCLSLSNHRWPVEWRPDSSDVAMAANSISIVLYRVVLTASISNEVVIERTNGEDREICWCCSSYEGEKKEVQQTAYHRWTHSKGLLCFSALQHTAN